MNKILFLVTQDALLSSDAGTLATDCISALLQLRAAGYDLVRIDSGLHSDTLRQSPFLQATAGQAGMDLLTGLLHSQGIDFVEHIEAAADASDADNADAMKAALLPLLARVTLDSEKSAVVSSSKTSSGTFSGTSSGMSRATSLGDSLNIPCMDIAAANGWKQLAETLAGRNRRASGHRRSNETDIQVELDLDTADKQLNVHTGLGFFDHMLEQLAKHGGFSMSLKCDGDLHIDEHHTVEDCALAIGETLRTALGDKRGIGRYGFLLPMDETEVQVSVDLSARPSFHFTGNYNRDKVGELSTELVPHFFKSLSDTLGASLHIKVTGDNAHHQVEATFKAVGRALGQAIKREGSELPTTKGML